MVVKIFLTLSYREMVCLYGFALIGIFKALTILTFQSKRFLAIYVPLFALSATDTRWQDAAAIGAKGVTTVFLEALPHLHT